MPKPSRWELRHGDVRGPSIEDLPTTFPAAVELGSTEAEPTARLLGGYIGVDCANAELVGSMLEPLVVMPASMAGRFAKLLDLIDEESSSGRPAASPILDRLLEIMLIEALRIAPSDRDSWRRLLPVHAAASVAFSAVHVGLMMGLRIAIYHAAGYDYHVEPGAALYEYRKDLLAYLVLGCVFHLLAGPRAQPATAPPTAEPDVLVIADGQRTWRLRPDEVVALRSAGNYVEFMLAAGQRPLVRATLAEWEQRLGATNFVRTHRSWLVNTRRVRSLVRTGSGDHSLTLDGDVVAPLSRRFVSALDRLRA